jgi:septal ring factor EnvC (AmiA/AmiB activator)
MSMTSFMFDGGNTQAASTASFSLDYALELEEKLAARDEEAATLRRQLEESTAELAASRQAAKAEAESARTAAVQQFLESEEYTRRVAEQALAAYERGAEVMKHVALRLNPRLDAAKLVLPLD